MNNDFVQEKEWGRHHPTLGKHISFRPVTLEQDLERLHQWMWEPHVIPYWQRAMARESYEKHLKQFLADTYQKLWIGSLDGIPMSYWETYWAKDDILAQYYDAHPADQGVHLLIGPPAFLGKGFARPMLQTLIRYLLQHKETEKIVAEPDIHNEKMIHIFKRCGFRFIKEISLPDKQAALMFCSRESFFQELDT